MPDHLGRMLKDAAIPDSSAGRDQARSLAFAATKQARPSVGPRVAIGIAASLLVVAALSLTPPGRALADDIAGLVGIGEEPTLDQTSDQDLPARDGAVVVDAGLVPGTSQPYEISAYGAEASEEIAGTGRDFGCLNFDLPGLDTQRQVRFESVCIDYCLLYTSDAADE